MTCCSVYFKVVFAVVLVFTGELGGDTTPD